MADKTKIEWTDATWNPIRGCTVVSEGCRNCYAMQAAARFSGEGQAYEGLAYRNESGAHWTGKVRLIEKHLKDPLRWQRPRRIFVNSMSDLFHPEVHDEWIDQIFAVMRRALPKHTFQVLTKRPERMLRYLTHATLNGTVAEMRVQKLAPANTPQHWYHATNWHWPLPNVWLGISVEDQESADERVPLLLETPAAVRWVSAEPLLGPIDLRVNNPYQVAHGGYRPVIDDLDWIVVGGESGPGARPMHPDWARALRDQCVAAGVPFFFKQWGEWDGGGVFGSECDDPCGRCDHAMPDGCFTGTDWEPGPHLQGSQTIHRVGKRAAGRLLDGREWSEYPDALAKSQPA